MQPEQAAEAMPAAQAPPDEAPTLEGILPAEPLEHAPAEPPSTTFKPWHLPRKQHVRKMQWAGALANLLDELPDRRLVKYLCLPGEDLLDVEVLATVCREKNRRLKYLGFDQSFTHDRRSTQRIAAEQILHQTTVVDEASHVLPDDFTSIARRNSIGNNRLRDGGSYDVVNLDMCDAFTTHDWAPTHAAILELLTHQTNRRGEPWLLFLTTRSEVERLQTAELEAYAAAIAQNAGRSQTFSGHLAALAGEQANDTRQLLDALDQRIQGDTYLSGRWLTIGIGKWLIGIMGHNEPWRVDLLSAYAYRTGLLSDDGQQYAGEPPNLFSLVYRFEKIPRVRHDPAGLVPEPAAQFADHDEVRLAEKLARAVEQHTLDLDRAMAADGATHQLLCTECESLLSVRYYSPQAYREWVARLPPLGQQIA